MGTPAAVRAPCRGGNRCRLVEVGKPRHSNRRDGSSASSAATQSEDAKRCGDAALARKGTAEGAVSSARPPGKRQPPTPLVSRRQRRTMEMHVLPLSLLP